MMTCRICGKRFVVTWPEHWVYRRKDVFLCSEDCMIVYDAQTTRAANGFGPKKKGEEENMAGKLTKEQRWNVVEIAIQGGSPIEYLKKCGIANPYASWDWIKKSLAKKDPVKHQKLMLALGFKNEDTRRKFEEILDSVDAGRKKPEKTTEELEAEAAEVINGEDAGSEKPVEVIKVDRVPPVEIPEQSVSMAPTPLILQGGVDYQLKVDEAAKQERKPPMNAIQRLAAELKNMPREVELRVIKIESELGTYTRGDVCRSVIYFRREIAEGDVIEVAMTEDDWRQLARELPKVLKTMGVDA